MHAALAGLKNIKANRCVLRGDPDLYLRFGFLPMYGLVLADVPRETFRLCYFMRLIQKDPSPTMSRFSAELTRL
ncbi:MAG: putative N-acetyltransferase YhbS [Candidatus Azotimanducaceae bacterium]|jgi:predicted N-acetyltransferase YhbS